MKGMCRVSRSLWDRAIVASNLVKASLKGTSLNIQLNNKRSVFGALKIQRGALRTKSNCLFIFIIFLGFCFFESCTLARGIVLNDF